MTDTMSSIVQRSVSAPTGHGRASRVEQASAEQAPAINSKAFITAQDRAADSDLLARRQAAELAYTYVLVNEENEAQLEDPAFAARLAGQMVDTLSTNGSSNDMLEEMQDLMERLQKEWLDRYSEILSKYVALFDKITTALNKLKDAITGTDDKGNFTVNFNSLLLELGKISEMGLGGGFDSRADAEAFLKELGVEWLSIESVAGGTYQLRLKHEFMSDLTNLFAGRPSTMTPTEYNTLITAKDNIMERLMHINRVLPDKNQRKLQLWDTLVKTFSGTVESISEVNKSVVGNVGA